LLARLEPIEYQAGEEAEQRLFDQTSLARVLLNLVDVTAQTEYELCQAVAMHLLGVIPEPDELEF
jgi:hypothetical protein